MDGMSVVFKAIVLVAALAIFACGLWAGRRVERITKS